MSLWDQLFELNGELTGLSEEITAFEVDTEQVLSVGGQWPAGNAQSSGSSSYEKAPNFND